MLFGFRLTTTTSLPTLLSKSLRAVTEGVGSGYGIRTPWPDGFGALIVGNYTYCWMFFPVFVMRYPNRV